jgi:luciferase-like monooxygenase
VATGFGIDQDQGLSEADEEGLIRSAADFGYESAWTNSGADAGAFDRCLRWHEATGLPVGISAVPASGRPASFYAQHARRLWDATNGRLTLVVGSGLLPRPAQTMPSYLTDLRQQLPGAMPLFVAALGPLMLRVAAQLADGVALNWCSAEWVEWSRHKLASAGLGRPMPRVIEYIRTAVDPDAELARGRVAATALRYALGMPAYRQHFERMGFAQELRRIEADGAPSPAFVSAIGAAGLPGETRQRFERLATGLDLPIVRILVARPGDVDSARRVLEECRPIR